MAESTPNPNEFAMAQALEMLRVGDFRDAADALRAILKKDPREAGAWDNLALAHMQLGEWDQAEKAMLEFIKLVPTDVVGLLRIGVILRRRNALNEARNAFTRALKIDPLQAVAHKELGKTLQMLGQLKEARTAYKEAVKLKPSYVEAWCGLGEVCDEENKPSLAVRVYNDSLLHIRSEKRGPIYARMGLSYGKLGDWASSRNALEKAIERGESDPRLTYALGRALSQLGEYTAAEQQQMLLESIGSDLKKQLKEEIVRPPRAEAGPSGQG